MISEDKMKKRFKDKNEKKRLKGYIWRILPGLVLAMIVSVMMTRDTFAYYNRADLFAYMLTWYNAKENITYSETLVEREFGSYEKGYIQPGERLMVYNPYNSDVQNFSAEVTVEGYTAKVGALPELEGIGEFARLTRANAVVYGSGKVSLITDFDDPDERPFDYNDSGTEVGTITGFLEGKECFNIYTFDKRAYFKTTGIKSPVGGETIDFVEAYEVILTDDGGGKAVPDEKYGIEGSQITIKAEPHHGYTFREWQLISGNTQIEDKFSPVTSFKFINEDVEIKAVFDPIPYTVTLLSDGNGSAYADKTSAIKGTSISVNAVPYYGYRFKEWQVTPEYVSVGADSFIMTDEDVTLRAVFEKIPEYSGTKIYTITFDANKGSVSPLSDITETDGSLYSLPVPVRDKYIFTGWWTKAKDGERVTTETVFDSDSTVYAHWEKEPEPEIIKYKQLDLEGRKINGEVPSVRLYFPRHTVAYDGKEHVAVGTKTEAGSKEGVSADLDITAEGIPVTVSGDYIYGKTGYAISYYALTLEPDVSSEAYRSLGENEKKQLDKEIKKINRVLKKKKNRIYYAVKPLDLSEFVYDAAGSKAGRKVFVRSDDSGDTLVYKKRTKRYTDPDTQETKRITRTELEATLSGYTFSIPSKEYKAKITDNSGRITGKNINLTGETK